MNRKGRANRFDRRIAMKLGAAGMVAPASVHVSESCAAQSFGANDQIRVGVIGLGSRGFNLVDAFLANADARITAICDVDHLHYRDNPWGKGTSVSYTHLTLPTILLV